MSLANTHFYDRKLSERLQAYRESLSVIDKLDNSVKLAKLKRLHSQLKNTKALRGLDMIIKTLQTQSNKAKDANYDPSNNIRAENVLYMIIEKMGEPESELYKDIFPILEEQLGDILGGSCPPGRTTRIFQAFVTVIESRNEAVQTEIAENSKTEN